MLVLEKVNKYFYKNSEREIHALRDINLTVSQGDFSVITGPSGCGKSTLLNAMGALDAIDSGSIILDETDIVTLNDEERAKVRLQDIGFIFQAYNLVPVLSARENIEFIMKLRGFDQELIDKRVKEIAEILEIDNKLDAMPNHLSGGQQQRVAVARAIAAKPKLILADEPTANLDSVNSTHLMQLMKQLNKIENSTIIFSSHDDYVVQEARKIIKLHDGQIVS